MGTLSWGQSGVANVYFAGERAWRDAFSASNIMVADYTNVRIKYGDFGGVTQKPADKTVHIIRSSTSWDTWLPTKRITTTSSAAALDTTTRRAVVDDGWTGYWKAFDVLDAYGGGEGNHDKNEPWKEFLLNIDDRDGRSAVDFTWVAINR